jgi:hypothetical protein
MSTVGTGIRKNRMALWIASLYWQLVVSFVLIAATLFVVADLISYSQHSSAKHFATKNSRRTRNALGS